MNIIIFGSTGRTGSRLVKDALDQGHKVTAFARNREKITVDHKNLHVAEGDVLDLQSVQKAMEGQEVVLCSIGMPNPGDKSQLRARGTKNILTAMKLKGAKRIIAQSVFGGGDSYKHLPRFYKLFIFPLILRNAVKDHNIQESYIRESGLNWTIVRPPNLTDKGYTGSYWYGQNPDMKKTGMTISYNDVSHFFLKELKDNEFLHKSQIISDYK